MSPSPHSCATITSFAVAQVFSRQRSRHLLTRTPPSDLRVRCQQRETFPPIYLQPILALLVPLPSPPSNRHPLIIPHPPYHPIHLRSLSPTSAHSPTRRPLTKPLSGLSALVLRLRRFLAFHRQPRPSTRSSNSLQLGTQSLRHETPLLRSGSIRRASMDANLQALTPRFYQVCLSRRNSVYCTIPTLLPPCHPRSPAQHSVRHRPICLLLYSCTLPTGCVPAKHACAPQPITGTTLTPCRALSLACLSRCPMGRPSLTLRPAGFVRASARTALAASSLSSDTHGCPASYCDWRRIATGAVTAAVLHMHARFAP